MLNALLGYLKEREERRHERYRHMEERLNRLMALDLLRRAAEQARRKRLLAASQVWTVEELLAREG